MEAEMKKGVSDHNHLTPLFSGRDEKIRTSDPLHPMQVRYQAALRPDEVTIISDHLLFLPTFRRCRRGRTSAFSQLRHVCPLPRSRPPAPTKNDWLPFLPAWRAIESPTRKDAAPCLTSIRRAIASPAGTGTRASLPAAPPARRRPAPGASAGRARTSARTGWPDRA